MAAKESFNYQPRNFSVESDNLQSIDHSRNIRYNNNGSEINNNFMLQSPDQNMSSNVNSARKPHPSGADPLEQRIRGLIREQAYVTPQGMKMWGDAREIQKEYFSDALSHIGEPDYVHAKTQETLKKIAGAMNAEIVSGRENAEKVKTPALVVLNHYSGYKLNAFEPEDINTDFGKMETLYPFPSFFASLVPVAETVGSGATLHDAHLEYSSAGEDLPLRRLQEEAGLLVIPEESGGFKGTLEATRQLIDKNPQALLVVFPEGESSGKRNNGTPYDMVDFHSGAFVIAAELGIPVLPAVQYFNPEKGFEVSVLPPLTDIRRFEKGSDGKPTEESKIYYEEVAKKTHDQMQTELNKLMGRTQ